MAVTKDAACMVATRAIKEKLGVQQASSNQLYAIHEGLCERTYSIEGRGLMDKYEAVEHVVAVTMPLIMFMVDLWMGSWMF